MLENIIAGEEPAPEWLTLNYGDKNVKINCLDVIIKKDLLENLNKDNFILSSSNLVCFYTPITNTKRQSTKSLHNNLLSCLSGYLYDTHLI